MSTSYQLSFAFSFLLLAVLAVVLPVASSTGIVNGYCNGYSSNLTCSIANLQSHSGIINSLAISSYHLSPTGLVIPCAKGDRDCPFPGDVEEYNARVVREVPGMLVVPLVFDNDGKTVEQTRAMWSNSYAAANIATLVNRTLQYNYSGLSMDWEPSCWMDQPSKCSWPTVEEAQAYTGFLTNLSAAFVAADRVLTICADHEVCEPDVDCGGDDYIKHCLADEYSMSWCNCCAFHTWSTSHTHPKDSYGDDHPFNASNMDAAVQPWFDAGCTADRMSFGLLSDQALSDKEASAVLSAVQALGVKRVDIWSQPWTWPNFTQIWSASFKQFIADNNSTVVVESEKEVPQHRHEHKQLTE